MAEAELARFIDRNTVEYIRVYPHPIERVWRAIIDPEEFGVWFIRGRLDPRVGGAYWFGDDGFQGVVGQIEPPRLLRLDDANQGTRFRYELEEVAGGTRMRFVHHIPPGGPYAEFLDDLGGDLPGGLDTPWRPGFVGGFHEFWDALADHLDGAPMGSRLPATEFGALSTAWTRKMERAGVFTAKQATRAAVSLRRHERWNELNKIYREHIKRTLPPAN
jgi:uncharacterized protein YndB with AHSA1/START domain